MRKNRRELIAVLAGAAVVPAVSPIAFAQTASAQTGAALSPEEARAIAKDVFLWGMHPVAIYHLRYLHVQNDKSPVYVGVGRLSWERKAKKANRVATTPNATTLYGAGFYDLSKEPVVITVGDIKDHYWSIQLCDNYARWWHLIGSQFNAPGPVRRLLIGPNWSGIYPAEFVGADVVQAQSDMMCVVGRVALTDDTAEELKAVNDIQDHMTVMSLSQWVAAGKKDVKAEDVPLTKGDYPAYPGMESVKEPGHLKGVDFLRWVSLVLNDPSFTKQTDGHAEIEALAKFERLGLKAGQTFDPDKLPPAIKAAVEDGIDDGRKAVIARQSGAMGIDMNGWSLNTDLGYRDTDWLQRAFYGYIAVLGPIPSRSHTGALGTKDSKARPLSGEHRYTITFDLNDLPPVTEFWEMPIYDREGYFHDNPLDRYAINSYMLKRGKLHTADGKLVIYVQNDEPKDAGQRKNWLPAPNEGFQFAPRFYGPYGPLIDGSYKMPGVVRTE
jgi:hypothetical protein